MSTEQSINIVYACIRDAVASSEYDAALVVRLVHAAMLCVQQISTANKKEIVVAALHKFVRELAPEDVKEHLAGLVDALAPALIDSTISVARTGFKRQSTCQCSPFCA